MIEDQRDKGGENEWRKKNGNFPRIVAHPCFFALTFNNLFFASIKRFKFIILYHQSYIDRCVRKTWFELLFSIMIDANPSVAADLAIAFAPL